MGIYSGHGSSQYLEGVKAQRGTPELKLSRRLFRKYPKGFGRIPEEVRNTPATSQGELCDYITLEVPKEAAECLNTRKWLTL